MESFKTKTRKMCFDDGHGVHRFFYLVGALLVCVLLSACATNESGRFDATAMPYNCKIITDDYRLKAIKSVSQYANYEQDIDEMIQAESEALDKEETKRWLEKKYPEKTRTEREAKWVEKLKRRFRERAQKSIIGTSREDKVLTNLVEGNHPKVVEILGSILMNADRARPIHKAIKGLDQLNRKDLLLGFILVKGAESFGDRYHKQIKETYYIYDLMPDGFPTATNKVFGNINSDLQLLLTNARMVKEFGFLRAYYSSFIGDRAEYSSSSSTIPTHTATRRDFFYVIVDSQCKPVFLTTIKGRGLGYTEEFSSFNYSKVVVPSDSTRRVCEMFLGNHKELREELCVLLK